MSKLNDSTLKIFKKYRLDTNMSVFGNENKLYDVVKVMDDMVGNQVSKYAFSGSYYDSLSTTNKYGYNYTDGTFTEIAAQKTTTIANKRIILDPFTFKLIGDFSGKTKYPFSRFYCNDVLVGWIIRDVESDKVYVSSDINGENSLTGSQIPSGIYYVQGLMEFKDVPEYLSGSEIYKYWYNLIEPQHSWSSLNESVPKSVSGVVVVPQYIYDVLPVGYYHLASDQVYCRFSGGSSYTIKEV